MKKPVFAVRKYQLQDYNLHWTEQAMYCYKRNCRCEDCVMNEILENKCEMKYTVIEIVKLRGKPENKEELEK